MMTRLACFGTRRLPTIRAPADCAARERQTDCAPTFVDGIKKKIHHHGFSIAVASKHTTTKAATENEKELLIATKSRNA